MGDDTLIGGLGRDQLFGGAGSDLFVLTPNNGTDTIWDYEDGQDLILLEGGLTFNDLTISGRGRHKTLIRLNKPGDSSDGQLLAILHGVNFQQITEADFFNLNLPPVANDDDILLDEGGTVSSLVGGGTSLLENDTDPNFPNDNLTVSTTVVDGPDYGTLLLNPDGTFSYTHDGSETISDSFVYQIQDSNGAVDTGTVNITINPVNDAPVLDPIGDRVVALGQELSLTATATDVDLPLNTLTFSLAPGAPEGAVIDPETGQFTWTPSSEQLGDIELTIQVTDDGSPGLTTTETITISVQDQTSPELTAALANDTGGNNSDGVTFDPTITGTVADISGISALQLTIVGPSSGSFDVTSTVEADGSFSIDQSLLETLLGSSLQAGDYTFELKATDGTGNQSTPVAVSLTFDNLTNAPIVPDLLPGSDSGSDNSDNLTNITTPTVAVTAAPDEQVQLFVDGELVTTAATTGSVEFTLGQLNQGLHEVAVRTIDLAGNISDLSDALEITVDTVDPVLNITTPLNNGLLTPGALLSGTVDGTGSEIVALSYRFDDQPENSVAVENGAFNQVLDFSGISSGSHNLVITATDAAGNVTSISESIVIALDVTWINSTGGFWEEASNWDIGQVPGLGNNVFVNLPSNEIVTHRSGNTQIESLNISSSLTITNSQLSVANNSQIAGSVNANNSGSFTAVGEGV